MNDNDCEEMGRSKGMGMGLGLGRDIVQELERPANT